MNRNIVKKWLFFILFVHGFAFNATIAQAAISTLSAGISQQDRGEHPEFALKLVFFERSGSYIANVKVEIMDEQKNILLEEVSLGPWFFVGLNEGHYIVRATRQNGDQQGTLIHIPASSDQKKVALAFPSE